MLLLAAERPIGAGAFEVRPALGNGNQFVSEQIIRVLAEHLLQTADRGLSGNTLA